MRKFGSLLGALFGGILVIGLNAAPAHAQATRTWVSGVGDDANPCSRTAPCKTFPGAISKTAAGGEINCIDPGGFGTLTITKSISIVCDYTEGGLLAAGSFGISINAAATDNVYLSGLDFQGTSGATNGINVSSVGSLVVKNCQIRGFTTGINIVPSVNPAKVAVTDCTIAFNTQTGILVKPSGTAGARVAIDRTRVVSNGTDGVMANGTAPTSATIRVSVRDSMSSHNGADGFVAFSNGASTEMMIDSSTSFNNSRGVVASGTGAVNRFTRANVTANGTGVAQVGAGLALSYTTNSVDGNGTDGTFGTTPQK
jgi:hypothetical protein